MIKERRKRTRVPVGFDLTIMIKGRDIKVQTLNLSLTGVSVASDHPFSPQEPCEVHLSLHQDINLTIEGRVLRSSGKETIISFVSMDEDSFYHLKRLLQFNAPDPDLIEQEINDPAFS
ncbi:MAG: PilZ domain-containing protein [Smithellaceae bacterium]